MNITNKNMKITKNKVITNRIVPIKPFKTTEAQNLEEDFWKDCMENTKDDSIKVKKLISNKEKLTHQQIINIVSDNSIEKFIESKNSSDKNALQHDEYYLTFNDEKISNEITYENKRTYKNNINQFSDNIKINKGCKNNLIDEDKNLNSYNNKDTKNSLTDHTETANTQNPQASRNINKVLNDNINSKMTREEKFKCFLTKYSNRITTENDQLKTKASVKSIRAQEKCNLLHENSKIKNELSLVLFKKNNEVKIRKEMSECTFQPRTNSSEYIRINKELSCNEYIKKVDKMKNFYERSVYWKKVKIENLDRKKSELSRNQLLTFKPKINCTNLEIFNPKKNLINDFITRNYKIRLQKARNEEEIKRQIIERGCKQKRPLKSYNLRANSQENLSSFLIDSHSNIGFALKNLHRSLHAFDFNDYE